MKYFISLPLNKIVWQAFFHKPIQNQGASAYFTWSPISLLHSPHRISSLPDNLNFFFFFLIAVLTLLSAHQLYSN